MTDIVERLRKIERAGDIAPDGHVPLAKEAADEIERLREELVMVKRAKFCDEETIAEQNDEIERLQAQVTTKRSVFEAEIERLRARLRAEINQAPDEVLAHDNSQLRAEIERLRAGQDRASAVNRRPEHIPAEQDKQD